MDQWRSKFSESLSLDRYWSIECSSPRVVASFATFVQSFFSCRGAFREQLSGANFWFFEICVRSLVFSAVLQCFLFYCVFFLLNDV